MDMRKIELAIAAFRRIEKELEQAERDSRAPCVARPKNSPVSWPQALTDRAKLVSFVQFD